MNTSSLQKKYIHITPKCEWEFSKKKSAAGIQFLPKELVNSTDFSTYSFSENMYQSVSGNKINEEVKYAEKYDTFTNRNTRVNKNNDHFIMLPSVLLLI